MSICFHLIHYCVFLSALLHTEVYSYSAKLPNDNPNKSWSHRSNKVGFSWSNCGPITDAIRLLSFNINPDPIRLPGNIILSVSVNISKPLPADINAKVIMEKNVLGIWVKIPCEHDVGSCSYSICSNTSMTYTNFFENVDVIKPCPLVPPAIYSVQSLVININKSIPALADGAFRMTIDFFSDFVGHLACLQLGINLR